MRPRMQPTGALAEMLARDGELDRILDRGLDFSKPFPDPPPPPPPQPLVIEPVDWHQEEAERAERERQRLLEEAAALLEPQPEPTVPTYPAKPRTKTPKLDIVRRWRTEDT